jgi:hypothetical protein
MIPVTIKLGGSVYQLLHMMQSYMCVYVYHASCLPFISIISETGAAVWSKLTLSRLATITLKVVPFCAYALFPALLPLLCQNGGLSGLSSIGETEKSHRGSSQASRVGGR